MHIITLNLVAEDSSLLKFRGGAMQAQTTFLCSFPCLKQHEVILPPPYTATLADREAPFERVRGNNAEPNNETILFRGDRVLNISKSQIFEADPDWNSSQKHPFGRKFRFGEAEIQSLKQTQIDLLAENPNRKEKKPIES
jgi:hypothetical protein